MARFIELSRQDDRGHVFVNVEHVATVSPNHRGSVVLLVNDDRLHVVEDYDQVTRACDDAARRRLTKADFDKARAQLPAHVARERELAAEQFDLDERTMAGEYDNPADIEAGLPWSPPTKAAAR